MTQESDETLLLVSVRSAAEAETATAGGADLIDIKEPARGALGRAEDATIAAIVQQVAGRKPVSAALGELRDRPRLPSAFQGLVKIGLAGCGDLCASGLLHRITRAHVEAHGMQCELVLVAYADWQRAQSPPPATVLRLANELACPTFLIDTWAKDGGTLLDWLPLSSLQELRNACHSAQIRLALAGSLSADQIVKLLPLEPDVIAVRGAVCAGGRRSAALSTEAVRRLADVVHGRARKLSSTISVDSSPFASFGNH